ncbi:YhgE/Pip domain-containing protein [Bacillus sp. T33-2]|uniref:YhgE/Pip domain-containing protein n=1 Tax=Bacillus sp. T33-2 TaxID=2054168 RepID=UPI000C7698AD|nr:YhgE/Pip domain-containing protein [Bacillus sp. T33-2]PLR95316.1 hypothetical protein CVD19_15255 [Bacillus sp. T33-2]
MNVFSLLAAEFSKIAANKALLGSMIAALLVPVVYGGILLSAKWGPYDNLSNLPVAVVNNDKGAMSGETPVNVGKDLVENLEDGKALGWNFVDSATAMKGLQNNKYYMVIVLPEDLSERVKTVMDPDPKKLKIEYIQNEGLNFLASKVTETATERIREQLADSVTKEYTTTVFSSLDDVAEGFQKAADGSAQLADGTTQLKDGTTQLNQSVVEKSPDIVRLADGANQLKAGTGQMYSSLSDKQADITKLANGTKELKNGTATLLKGLQDKSGDIAKLADGSQQLHAGTMTLKDGTGQILDGLKKAQAGSQGLKDGLAGRLQSGTADVAAGALALEEGIKKYQEFNVTTKLDPNFQLIVEGAEKLRIGSAKVAQGVVETAVPGATDLNEGLNKLVAGQIKVDEGAAKLEAGARQIADGNGKVNSGWKELTGGVTRLDAGAAQISDGNAKVDEGWKALTAGAAKIDNGMGQVSNGTSTVNKGWGTLSEGTTKLNDGAGKVNDGSNKLAAGLKEGADKTSGLTPDKKTQACLQPQLNS